MWFDGPAHDLSIRNVEIADQTANGVNLHRGIRNALITYNRIRNVGDDGIASWSEGSPNEHVIISGNQITAPGLANGIAIYGGRDIEVTGNVIADTLVEGGGIHLGSRFRSAPFAGKILVANNSIVRAGSMDPNWHFGVGAIWIYAFERPISADIRIDNNRIDQPSCEAIQLLGPQRIDGVHLSNLRVRGLIAT